MHRPARQPGLADVERALARSGVLAGPDRRACSRRSRPRARAVRSRSTRPRRSSARARPSRPRPKIARGGGRPCVLALVGARAGAGTTTLAKLAGRLVRQRRRVALVGLARRRARERGPARARDVALVLQVPFDAVQNAAELVAVLERSRSVDVVLLDTHGRSRGATSRCCASARAPRRRAARSRRTSCSPATRLPRRARGHRRRLRGRRAERHRDHQARRDARARAGRSSSPSTAAGRSPSSATGPTWRGTCTAPTGDKLADLFLRGRLA